jgi:hypothetical protein
MHNFFQQVRARSRTNPTAESSTTLNFPALDSGLELPRPERQGDIAVLNVEMIATLNSPPIGKASGDDDSWAVLPHERLGEKAQLELQTSENFHGYLTPPVLSVSLGEDRKSESGLSNSRSASGAGSSAGGNGNLLEDASKIRAERLASTVPSPTSAVISYFSACAAHILNPSSRSPSTSPTSPTVSIHTPSGCSSASSSYLELKKLTEGVVLPPRKKNTPPQTPRGTTSAGNVVEKQSLTATLQPVLPGIPSVSCNGNANNDISPGGPTGTIAATAPGSGAAVGPPKGKLTVKIIEARGLRPSHDPYVVCVFEWNEYISKGPRRREIDIEQDEGSRNRDDSGGVPIGVGDVGRRIAIPMKSRQSSNTSLPDHKEPNRDGKTTSNPKWEQEAVLYDPSVCLNAERCANST